MKNKYILYMLSAALCTGINLGTQYLLKLILSPVESLNTLFLGQELYFYIQFFIGTNLGFITKFALDKFIVFKQKHTGMGHTAKQFLIYSLNSFITTAIYFGFEFTFKLVFSFEHSDLTGGFIGLAIGYTIKFFLDRKFVFSKTNGN